MKGFTKGSDPRRNTKGRPKGKPNKSTEALRATIKNFIEVNLSRLQSDFDSLEPKERLSFINGLLRHVLPPPLTPESLNESQLQDLMEYIKTSIDEKT